MKSALRLASVLFLAASSLFAASAPTPSEFLKFEVGADRKLADYRQITAYFRALEKASPRVKIEVLGKTTLGEDMIMAIISSEENLKNAKAIQAAAKKLADPRGLSEAELDRLAKDGKVVLLVTCNIHASEIGSTQMAMEWAHALATADDAQTKKRLDNVVLLLVPSLNPDGQIMETEWYRKNLGTKFEGSRMPWLYHHYVGHDNNRDWFQLTQKETKAMTRSVYTEWFPQVWLDEHQMGSTGARIFVPPYSDPVSTEIHPLVWREVNLIGSNMALRMEQAGKTGIIYGAIYDAYWPGGTKNTAWWKNVSGLLTEVASVRLATPIEIAPGELAGGRKGMIEYGPQTNFPNPWPGGVWRLRDIMDYERIASDALLEECSERRADFIRDMAVRSRAAIATFGPKDAYRIPMGASQRDRASAVRLAALMAEHGAEVKTADNGDIWIPLAQPYGKFVREMFSTQRYPEVRLVAGKDIVRPYDVAAWTMPMMMGVDVEQASLPDNLKAFAPAAPKLPADGTVALAPGSPENAKAINAALKAKAGVSVSRAAAQAGGKSWPAGTVFLDAAGAKAAAEKAVPGLTWTSVASAPGNAEKMTAPRVGLYKPWAASMDEGWTRWILEQYGFDSKSLDNKTIKAGKLSESFDVIVLPDVGKEIIANGKPKPEEGAMKYFPELPPEYAGGIEKEGAKALHEFVEAGGTIVALASSTEWVIDEFNIPVRNVLSRVRPDEFGCPGSLLNVQVAAGNPLTYGLPAHLAVFQDKAIAFETAPPASELQRWVLATYPGDGRDILASGWIHGEDRLEKRAAAVATTFGKGKLVLLGFRAQHRAQTSATFPFLFNALYWSTAK
ncbi:MAG TPA: M14 metallopeptidase family protein [Thermoanaerobaculia bacterium]|nr:M14 metallopeptidase family protein [Thermoanaerobaculia bacterium]